MAADGSVVILIEGDDHDLKSKLSGIGSVASSAAKTAITAIAGISTALATAAGAAVKVGAAYETSLAKVGTIADTSVKSLSDLSGDILQLSNDTGEGAAGLNEALYSAISAGADTEHAVDLVAVAVKAARGGFTDTETAVDGLTSALNAYGMETADAQGLANKFLVTQNLGKTTFGQLAGSIGTVAPTANAAGVSVEELLASVASLTANGIGTSEAMTGMKAALSNVIKPTGEAAKLAEQLGIDFSAASLQTKGWAGFLADLQEKTGGNTDQMATLFGSVEALNTVLTLTSEQGTALMTKTLGEMATNATALDDAYETMSSTLEVTVQKIGTNLQNLGVQFYESVQGPAQDAANGALEAVQTLSAAFQEEGLSGAVQALGGLAANALTTLASAAPAFIDTAVELVQSFLSGLRDNLPEIATAALDIVGSLAGGILETMPELAQTGTDIILQLAQSIIDGLPGMVPAAVQTLASLVEQITGNLSQIIDAGIQVIVALGEGIIEALPDLISKVPEIVSNIANVINDNAPKLLLAAGKLILELVKGLIVNIPVLIANVPKIIQAVVDVWSAFNWLQLGTKAITAIKDGILKIIPAVKTAGKNVLDAVINAIKSLPQTLAELGRNGVTGLANAIRNLAGMAKSAMGDLVSGILNSITSLPSKMLEIGGNIVRGIANGIKNGAAIAINAVADLARSVIDGAKNFFGIKSPSRVMAKEVGPYLPQGVAVGVEKEVPKTERAVSKQLSGLTNRVRAAVEAEMASISVGLTAKGNGYDPPEPAPNGSLVVNVYTGSGMPESTEKARNLGRELGQETARELRRRGMAPT